MRRILDRALDAAIRRAGAPGPIRYTERQLYYELCRVLQPLHRAHRRVPFTLPAPIGYERYRAAVERRRGNSDITGLITVPGPAAPGPRSAASADITVPGPASPGLRSAATREGGASEGPGTRASGASANITAPDLFDYGFPRLLVCQDRAVAAMLLANELHMESACPVFSTDDLPLDPRIVAALHRAGNATVSVLHDASAAGFAAVEEVRRWAGDLRVAALGLRPAHAAALHLTATRAARTPDIPTVAGLEAWERRWLRAGRSTEVAAVNPARLLRTIHRLVRGRARPRPQLPRLRQIQAVGFMSWPTGGSQ